jgi:hypothetical protein
MAHRSTPVAVSSVQLRPGGVDPVETPIVVAGWTGAIAMAVSARVGRYSSSG